MHHLLDNNTFLVDKILCRQSVKLGLWQGPQYNNPYISIVLHSIAQVHMYLELMALQHIYRLYFQHNKSDFHQMLY